MSTCERVNADECHSTALLEVILQEMWQNILCLDWAVKALGFCLDTSFDPLISAVSRNQNLTSCLNMFYETASTHR